jgi:hypothetical protein
MTLLPQPHVAHVSDVSDARPRATIPAPAPRSFSGHDRAATEHAQSLAKEIERERIRREARRRLDAEERGVPRRPDILKLRDWLLQPAPDVHWRIEGLQPADTRVVLAAQMKAGKTTVVGALVRSLVDGDPFLGRYPVHPIAGRVAVIDAEMPPRLLRQWLATQNIQHTDRVIIAPLRGQASSFNVLDPETRARWTQWLRAHAVEYLVLDCLRPVLDALGLDEHAAVGPFLVAFDQLLLEAEIVDALIVHHMGHVAERSRGDSRLRDWPDVEWKVVRQSDDPGSARFFSAYGRDVHLRESELRLDATTRRLTMADGSRRDASIRAALTDVLAVLKEASASRSARDIQKACATRGDHSRNAIRSAIAAGVRTKVIDVEDGPQHRLHDECASAPECADSSPAHSVSSQCASAPAAIERRTANTTHKRHPRRPQKSTSAPANTDTKPPGGAARRAAESRRRTRRGAGVEP